MKRGSAKQRAAEDSPSKATTSKKVFLKENGAILTRIIVDMVIISTACATGRIPALQLGLQGRSADAVMQITLRGQMPQCNLPKAFFDAESVRPVFDRRKERRRIHQTVSDRAAY